MRQRLVRLRAIVVRLVQESAWAPLAARGAGIALGMALLAAIGAGWLDGALDLGPPRAEAAAAVRGLRTRPAPPGPEHPIAAKGASAPSGAVVPHAAPPSSSGPAPSSPGGKVVLNTASELDLQRLPGVGPAKARAIAALRAKLGGKFRRFEDLLRVRGIKRRSLERIRAHAVLDPPPVDEAPPSPPPPAG